MGNFSFTSENEGYFSAPDITQNMIYIMVQLCCAERQAVCCICMQDLSVHNKHMIIRHILNQKICQIKSTTDAILDHPCQGCEREKRSNDLNYCSSSQRSVGRAKVTHAVVVIFLEFFSWGLLTTPMLTVCNTPHKDMYL